MNNKSETLDDILYGKLQPWLEENRPDGKFDKPLSNNAITTDFPFRYKIDFFRHFNHKTKYFSRLIYSELDAYCNRLVDLINEDSNENLVRYWLNDTLNKNFKTRLKDIATLIKEKDFQLVYIDPRKAALDIDQEHKTNTYILQLLKFVYVQLYLEVQSVFERWIDDAMIIEDFYLQIFKEPIPDKFFIHKIQQVEAELETARKRKTTPRHVSIDTTSFTYKQYDTNPEKINDVFDSLKKNQLISEETTLPAFKKIFSGGVIKTPVVWRGNFSELFYFIKLIYSKYKLVEDLKQRHWKVTCMCFVDSEGNYFDREKFRSSQKPQATFQRIEKIVELLK